MISRVRAPGGSRFWSGELPVRLGWSFPSDGFQRGHAPPTGSANRARRGLSALALLAATIAASSAAAGEAARLMEAKSIDDQRQVLLHAVRSGAHDCAKVSDHMYVGDKGGMDFFAVRCSGGNEYMISIEGAGEMQSRVMMCSVLEALGVNCFQKL